MGFVPDPLVGAPRKSRFIPDAVAPVTELAPAARFVPDSPTLVDKLLPPSPLAGPESFNQIETLGVESAPSLNAPSVQRLPAIPNPFENMLLPAKPSPLTMPEAAPTDVGLNPPRLDPGTDANVWAQLRALASRSVRREDADHDTTRAVLAARSYLMQHAPSLWSPSAEAVQEYGAGRRSARQLLLPELPVDASVPDEWDLTRQPAEFNQRSISASILGALNPRLAAADPPYAPQETSARAMVDALESARRGALAKEAFGTGAMSQLGAGAMHNPTARLIAKTLDKLTGVAPANADLLAELPAESAGQKLLQGAGGLSQVVGEVALLRGLGSAAPVAAAPTKLGQIGQAMGRNAIVGSELAAVHQAARLAQGQSVDIADAMREAAVLTAAGAVPRLENAWGTLVNPVAQAAAFKAADKVARMEAPTMQDLYDLPIDAVLFLALNAAHRLPTATREMARKVVETRLTEQWTPNQAVAFVEWVAANPQRATPQDRATAAMVRNAFKQVDWNKVEATAGTRFAVEGTGPRPQVPPFVVDALGVQARPERVTVTGTQPKPGTLGAAPAPAADPMAAAAALVRQGARPVVVDVRGPRTPQGPALVVPAEAPPKPLPPGSGKTGRFVPDQPAGFGSSPKAQATVEAKAGLLGDEAQPGWAQRLGEYITQRQADPSWNWQTDVTLARLYGAESVQAGEPGTGMVGAATALGIKTKPASDIADLRELQTEITRIDAAARKKLGVKTPAAPSPGLPTGGGGAGAVDKTAAPAPAPVPSSGGRYQVVPVMGQDGRVLGHMIMDGMSGKPVKQTVRKNAADLDKLARELNDAELFGDLALQEFGDPASMSHIGQAESTAKMPANFIKAEENKQRQAAMQKAAEYLGFNEADTGTLLADTAAGRALRAKTFGDLRRRRAKDELISLYHRHGIDPAVWGDEAAGLLHDAEERLMTAFGRNGVNALATARDEAQRTKPAAAKPAPPIPAGPPAVEKSPVTTSDSASLPVPSGGKVPGVTPAVQQDNVAAAAGKPAGDNKARKASERAAMMRLNPDLMRQADEVAALAKPKQPALNALLAAVVAQVPGSSYKGTAKTPESIAWKVERKSRVSPGYDVFTLKDHTRGTIYMADYADVPAVIAALQAAGAPSLRGEAHIDQPLNLYGYRGIMLSVSLGDRINGEIQLHTAASWAIKIETDPLYQKFRQWDGVELDEIPATTAAAMRAAQQKSAALYDAFWDAVPADVKTAASAAVKGLDSRHMPAVTPLAAVQDLPLSTETRTPAPVDMPALSSNRPSGSLENRGEAFTPETVPPPSAEVKAVDAAVSRLEQALADQLKPMKAKLDDLSQRLESAKPVPPPTLRPMQQQGDLLVDQAEPIKLVGQTDEVAQAEAARQEQAERDAASETARQEADQQQGKLDLVRAAQDAGKLEIIPVGEPTPAAPPSSPLRELLAAKWSLVRGTWFAPDGRQFTNTEAAYAALQAGEPAKTYTQLDDLNDRWWNSLFKARAAAKTVGLPLTIATPAWNDLPRLADAVEAWIQQDRSRPVVSPPTVPAKEDAALVPGTRKLIEAIKTALGRGKKLDNPTLDFLAAESFGRTKGSGAWTSADAYDAAEAGLNAYLLAEAPLRLREFGGDNQRLLAWLRGVVDLMPRQTSRTAEKDAFQQFSTPPTEAYLVALAANIKPGDVFLEPSAGVGSLAIWAKIMGATVHVNEIAPRRAALLRELGFQNVTAVDGEALNDLLDPSIRPTVIGMNPPFSATGGRVAKNKTAYGAKHVEQALWRLADGGRLVAIVGEGMGLDKPRFGEWWQKMAGKYTVRANIGIAGEEYGKFGTTFGNQLLVFDKTGPTAGVDWKQQIGNIIHGGTENLETALERISGIPQRSGLGPVVQPATARPVVGSGGGEVQPSGGVGRPPVTGGSPGGGRVGSGKGGASGSVVGPQEARPDQSPATAPSPEPGPGLDRPAGSGTVSGGAGSAADVRPSGSVAQPAPPAAPAPAQRQDEAGGAFVKYAPAVDLGGKKHPADLVESASMAAVEPVQITAVPAKQLRDRAADSGMPSDVQLEAIALTRQRHNQTLPSGQRAGVAIGAGTGVGKGIVLAGGMADAYHQDGVRRFLWLSVSNDLIESSARDLKDVGLGFLSLKQLNEFGADDVLSPKMDRGVFFSTYSTLIAKSKKGQTRLKQIADWLGNDGYVVFDEGHKAANALAGTLGQPTQTGLAVIGLQDQLPKLRVVYSSATQATEARHLAYMPRLGLWGKGTPFGTVQDFIGQLSDAAAMEMVARDMKALGTYWAPMISYQGVSHATTEHTLTPAQEKMQESAAKAWQAVMQNIDEALGITNGGPWQRMRAMSVFWSSNQRFWRTVLAGFKMPTVIQKVDALLKSDHAVVIMLEGTGEARTKELVNKAAAEGEELDALDFTPRETLGAMIEAGFPTQLFQDATDPSTGQTIKVAVKDADGNPVHSQEALRLKQKLLDSLSDLQLPDNPLDQLRNHYGDNFAEISGRKKVLKRNPVTGKTEYLKRAPEGVPGHKVNTHEASRFMDGKAMVAGVTPAGSVGITLHSWRRAKNQKRRAGVYVELPWSATIMVQKNGRIHRSDLAPGVAPPHFEFIFTNVGGEKRFVSSAMRRMGQLGSLSRGERSGYQEAGSLSDFNLETVWGEAALSRTYQNILSGKEVPGLADPRQALKDMGILKEDKDGRQSIGKEDMDNVTRFLNRVLALPLREQNALFEYFAGVFDQVQEYAKQNGLFDAGVSDIKGDSITMQSEPTVVATDPVSGAKTQHVQLGVTNPTDPFHWKAVLKVMADEPDVMSLARNDKSSNPVLVEKMGRMTDPSTGQIIERTRIWRPSGTSEVMSQSVFDQRYTAATAKDVAADWLAAVDKMPKTQTRTHHVITGALLPIWRKLQVNRSTTAGVEITDKMRIVRVKTDDGRRVVGVEIASSDLATVLQQIGVKVAGSRLETPAQVSAAVLGGEAVNLVGGLTLRRGKIGGEDVIKVEGAQSQDFTALRDAGLSNERKDFKQLFWVPSDNVRHEAVLGRLLDQFAVVDPPAAGGNAVAETGPGYGGWVENYWLATDGRLITSNLGHETDARRNGFLSAMDAKGRGWLRVVATPKEIMADGWRDNVRPAQKAALEDLAERIGVPVVLHHGTSARTLYQPFKVRESGLPAAAGGSTVSADQVAQFVAGQEITDPVKVQAAQDGITSALQHFETLRENGGSQTPWLPGLLDSGVPSPATPAAPKRAPRKPLLDLDREARALNQDAPAAIAALRDKGHVSAIIPGLVSRTIPVWDITGTIISQPADLAATLWAVSTPYFESMKVAVMDSHGRVVQSAIVSVGSRNAAIVEPSQIIGFLSKVRETTGKNYTRVIIAHNHPSGDPTPSSEDIAISKRLVAAANSLGFRVEDHLITNGGKYVSLREIGVHGDVTGELGQKTPKKIVEAQAAQAASVPRLPANHKTSWEVVSRGELPMIQQPSEISALAKALRNDDPTAGHVFYLTTKMRLAGIERLTNITGRNMQDVLRQIHAGGEREGAAGVIVDISGIAESNRVAEVERLEKWGKLVGLEVSDVVASDPMQPGGFISYREQGVLERPAKYGEDADPSIGVRETAAEYGTARYQVEKRGENVHLVDSRTGQSVKADADTPAGRARIEAIAQAFNGAERDVIGHQPPAGLVPSPDSAVNGDAIGKEAAAKTAEILASIADGGVLPPFWKRVAKLELIRKSATDTLRQAGGAVASLAPLYERYVDDLAAIAAKLWAPFERLARPWSGATRKAVFAEFENILLVREAAANSSPSTDAMLEERGLAGKTVADLEAAARSETRELLKAVRTAMQFTSQSNQDLAVYVYEPGKGGTVGKWRPIGSYGADYWPRVVRDDVREILDNPNKNPARYEELLTELMTKLGTPSSQVALDHLKASLGYELAEGNDFMSNLEMARANGLPQHWYEHRFERLIPHFVTGWARRISQIKNFGQHTHAKQQDAFDNVLRQVHDKATEKYVKEFRNRVYEVRRGMPAEKAMQALRTYTTVSKLSNWWTAIRNSSTVFVNTLPEFGTRATVPELVALHKLGANIRSAREAGVLRADLIAGMAEAQEFSERQRKLINVALKVGGFTPVEMWTRATTAAIALNWARWHLARIEAGRGIEDRSVRLFMAKLQKLGINVDQLRQQGLGGLEGEKLMRAASENTQFAYDLRQTPLWADHPAAKFLFQFQKFGLQQWRRIEKDVLAPAFRGYQVGGKRVRDYGPLLYFLALTIGTGAAMLWLRETLFGKRRPDAPWREIIATAEDGAEARAAELAVARVFHDAIYAGGFGIIGDWAANAEDFAVRTRGKSPLNPPGLSGVNNLWSNIVKRWKEQGRLTMADLAKWAKQELPAYNYADALTRQAGGAFADSIGRQWDAARRLRINADIAEIKRVSNRYLTETQGEGRAGMAAVRTARTPLYNELQSALLLGDIKAAKNIKARILADAKTPSEKAQALAGMMGSVRNRRPLKVGGAEEERSERLAFGEWLGRRRPDLAPVLKELDSRYLATAHGVGLGNHPLAADLADQAAAAREQYGLDAWLRQAVIDRAAAASGIDPKELGRRFDERVFDRKMAGQASPAVDALLTQIQASPHRLTATEVPLAAALLAERPELLVAVARAKRAGNDNAMVSLLRDALLDAAKREQGASGIAGKIARQPRPAELTDRP